MDKQPTSRTCFLCGRENDTGLKMTWYNDYENKRIVSTVTVPEHFNGYPGVVHGGITAAILDETAGRAIMVEEGFEEEPFVTLKLEVSYRRPTPTCQPLTVIGRVLNMTGGRARVESEIRLEDDTVTAECTAIVVKPPKKFTESMEKELKYWYVEDD